MRKGTSVSNNRLTATFTQQQFKQGNAFFNHMIKSKSRDLEQPVNDDFGKTQMNLALQNSGIAAQNQKLYQTGQIVVNKAD